MGERQFFLSPLLEGLDLDLNTCYQLAHLTADITMLLEVLHTPSENVGFPPLLGYRIRPANVCVNASTQTDSLPAVPAVQSSNYQTDEDMAFSDLGSDVSPNFSPVSPEYTPPYTSAGYHSSPGHTPFYQPFSPYRSSLPDYSPTSPMNSQ
ncbi:uncharacterized protein LOC108272854 [Ictalurus punctatus]|uniref:Uncharacterized protein LOC108272854 n=1 Tax=Ictalurus punctatus TaxID=7998 RepID=A0A2D0S4K7_ICTPU|nr:uncharacterized protein LOC108272854 [Ictalurus punctatus]